MMDRGTYWHVFPTYREAKNAVWRDPNMLFNILPEEFIEKRNDSELVLWLKGGSILQLIGADTPSSHLGSGPIGVVLDEYEEMKVEMWERVVEPILRANNGWCWFIGTPKGKNHFFEAYQKGTHESEEWKSWILRANESGIFTKEQLDNTKLSMRQALFNQEMMCEFLEGEGSVFRGVREVMNAVAKKPETRHLYVMGVDLAKVKDHTVLSIFDRTTNCQVYQDRFQTLEWPFQKQRIIQTARHYNNALTIIDATGLGDPIADDLVRAGIAVEPFKLTSESKKDIIEKLSIWIEQMKVQLLPIQETAFEFDNFSYEIGPSGKVRYNAIEGFNDDIVISIALAVWSLQPLIIQRPLTEIPKVRYALQQAKKAYEKSQEDQWNEWDS